MYKMPGMGMFSRKTSIVFKGLSRVHGLTELYIGN